ncbi:hemicentin-1 [Aplysia californica]|uniref:Hemicentin-1 n=1 Tax=Aplysia californica TaxID=6500 RepID=A0ABM1AFS6_APLCA|nr:hemicentin-1 [Aplysia californica]
MVKPRVPNDLVFLQTDCCTTEYRHLCEDVDECETGTHTCHVSTQKCRNDLGTGYSCVNIPPTPTASGDLGVFLQGSDVTMYCTYTGPGFPSKFTWYKAGLYFTDQNQTILMISHAVFLEDASYRCTVTVDGVESALSNGISLVGSFPPDQPTLNVTRGLPVPAGESVTLNCTTSIDGNDFLFLWKKNGLVFIKQAQPDLHIVSFFPGDSASYTCQVQNTTSQLLSPESNDILLQFFLTTPELSVYTLPRVAGDTPRKTLQVVNGSDVELTCKSPDPVEHFLWKTPQSLTTSMTLSETFELLNFTSVYAGNYMCFSKIGDVKSAESNNVTIEESTRPRLTSSLTNVPEGTLVKLSCQSHNPVHLRFRWQRDGVTFGEGTEPTYKILNFEKKDEGEYRCLAGDIRQDWTVSTAENLTAIPYNSLCKCMCIANSTTVEISRQEIHLVTSEIERNLSVDHTHLSSTVRKRTSAPDERKSSVSTGSGAIVMLSLVFCAIVIPDLVTAFYYIKATVQAGGLQT